MDFIDYLDNLDVIKKITSEDKCLVSNTNDSFNALLLSANYKKYDGTIFVVCPNITIMQKYYEMLVQYVPFEDVLFFPADELLTTEMLASSGDFTYERIMTLCELVNNKHKIVITNTSGLMKKTLPKAAFKDAIFTLEKDSNIEPNTLVEKLLTLGYTKVNTTVKTGEFSKRSSIIDIFPFGLENPIRIDFFDDFVDTIKEFDPTTQRSTNSLKTVTIKPMTEMIYSNSLLEKALEKLESFKQDNKLTELELESLNSDSFKLEERTDLDRLIRYLDLFYDKSYSLLDYSDLKRIYYIEPYHIKEVYENTIKDLNEYLLRLGGFNILKLNPYNKLDFTSNYVGLELLRKDGKPDYIINRLEVPNYEGNLEELLGDINRLRVDKHVVLAIKNNHFKKALKRYFDEHDLFYQENDQLDLTGPRVYFSNCNFPSLHLANANIVYINEDSILKTEEKKAKPRYKSIFKNAVKISRYDELNIGDYVVHYDYGIGRYLGLKTMENDGVMRDYIYVGYRNNSSLYIPVENIKSIMKYAPKEVTGITLNEIGGTEWARTKAKARKKIRDISDKLINLYAARKAAVGYQYPPDDKMAEYFASDFPYELTVDQKKAISEVTSDMESLRPMDRLVCGDVGYGKTEVALRATFKAAYFGKQVAVLAPTTILANQHYHNFKERMENYGLRVELLCRLVPTKKQKEIINDLKEGKVDIVVGTHRILGKDIEFKDLGLLIVDEEQRFGVSHKERIKELKVNVDCITLSATPIPRTLQMSMVGIKDLSMIETPPKNRYPVQTYVMGRSDNVIRDAIMREISRGGQVFYLYNYVESIEEERNHLLELVPSARICIVHGQLKPDLVEKHIMDFIDHKYDILLCTTIIETGIDMPDTNTLIIHDADRLGLSQLYQIRGRVGRSNKIAYAYLMYKNNKTLTDEAYQRLSTLKEFTELGSGFKIAMRDLQIRGSGDLLGAEQSGFIDSIGLDMYLRILDEEINHKGEENMPTSISYDQSLLKPIASMTVNKDYIESEDNRIDMHKRIESLTTINELDALASELIDRFGEIDEHTHLYMYETLFKNLLKELGFKKKEESVVYDFDLILDRSKVKDGKIWFTLTEKFPNITLKYFNDFHVVIKHDDKLKMLKDASTYLSMVKEALN